MESAINHRAKNEFFGSYSELHFLTINILKNLYKSITYDNFFKGTYKKTKFITRRQYSNEQPLRKGHTYMIHN